MTALRARVEQPSARDLRNGGVSAMRSPYWAAVTAKCSCGQLSCAFIPGAGGCGEAVPANRRRWRRQRAQLIFSIAVPAVLQRCTGQHCTAACSNPSPKHAYSLRSVHAPSLATSCNGRAPPAVAACARLRVAAAAVSHGVCGCQGGSTGRRAAMTMLGVQRVWTSCAAVSGWLFLRWRIAVERLRQRFTTACVSSCASRVRAAVPVARAHVSPWELLCRCRRVGRGVHRPT